jgi:hypothetical protein
MVGSKDRNHDLRFSCNLVQIAMSLNARYGVVAQGPDWPTLDSPGPLQRLPERTHRQIC